MKELDLIQLWVKARNHIIVSQLAPTGLLIFAIAILPSMTMADLDKKSRVADRIVATKPWLAIVKFGTPGIFTLTYIAILMQLALGYGHY